MSATDPLQPFRQAITDLGKWVETNKLKIALIGGLAVGLRSRPRLTQDIDVLMWSEDPPDEAFLEAAKSFGFHPRISDALEFAKKNQVLLLKHVPSGAPLDIALGFLPFEGELFQRSELLPIASGVPLPVATAEDLLIMKVISGRPRDWVDAEFLIETNPDIDRARVERWSEEYLEALGVMERLERLKSLFRRVKHA